MLSSHKKEIKEFKQFAGIKEDKVAKEHLSKHKWNVQEALNDFFTKQGPSAPAPAAAPAAAGGAGVSLDKAFAEYDAGGGDAGMIVDLEDGGENLQRFFGDMGLSEDEREGIKAQAIFFILGCKNPGEISKQEFTTGFSKIMGGAKGDPKKAMKEVMQNQLTNQLGIGQKKQLKGQSVFKEFYMWLFEFNREEETRKTLDRPEAVDLWRDCLRGRTHSWTNEKGEARVLLDEWLKFLAPEEEPTGDKKLPPTINKDLWSMFLEFAVECETAKYDGHSKPYEDSGAWPVIVDDFCEFIGWKKD